MPTVLRPRPQLTLARQSETVAAITGLGGRHDADRDGGDIGSLLAGASLAAAAVRARRRRPRRPELGSRRPSPPDEPPRRRQRRRPLRRLRIYPRYEAEPDGVYPRYYPGPQCGAGLHRDLCAGIPAERHGDRAAHELLLASRLELRALSAARTAPISPAPTTSADVPQTMMAIASCVKLLAVPGPPPGPWEAKAASAHKMPVATRGGGDSAGRYLVFLETMP